jgi:hypothetical protein
MDQIKSYLTPAERQELFRQFKSALRVKSSSVRRTSRIYEWQLKKLKQQHEQSNLFSRIPSTDDLPQY